MDFKSHQLAKPSTSEAACIQNTSPETLEPLLMGFLYTMTGLHWTVRIEKVPVDVLGDLLQVRASVNMSVPRSAIGTEPEIPEMPKEELS